jgi:phage-related protein
MNNWTISFYINNRGDELVQDFIRNQDEQTQSKITRNIDLVSKYGPNLGMPHSRYMGNGIYELRIRGNNEVRIFYISIIMNREVMFIHVFKKRTQKTPPKELKIAISRKKELT